MLFGPIPSLLGTPPISEAEVVAIVNDNVPIMQVYDDLHDMERAFQALASKVDSWADEGNQLLENMRAIRRIVSHGDRAAI